MKKLKKIEIQISSEVCVNSYSTNFTERSYHQRANEYFEK